MVNSYATPGQQVSVPIVLTSEGNERTVAFSLNYDNNPFAGNPTVVCGSSAPGCTVTFNNSTAGGVGTTVTTAAPLSAGPREVARVLFQSLATNLASTPVTFGNVPIVRLITDSANNPLPANYADGLVVFAQGIEGDIANRNTGDGVLLPNDVVLARQFVVGTMTPNPAFNEFQRADTSPVSSKGDGQLDATDIVQERRYVAGLDEPTAAGGPGGPQQTLLTGPELVDDTSRATTEARTMRIAPASSSPGSKVTVAVDMDTHGSEVATSFTLNFDPRKLTNPVMTMGSGVPSTATLTTNKNDAIDGVLSVLVDSSEAFIGNQIVTISFDIAESAKGGETPIAFTDTQAHRGTSDAEGNHLATSYENGAVSISGPAATGVEVSGRVLTPDGRGLRNAIISLTDQNGVIRTVTSGAFGYYTFDNVRAGENYTIGVSSRQYRFGSRTLRVANDLADMDIVGEIIN